MKRLLLLVGLFIACAVQTSAEKVSEQKAYETAQRFFSRNMPLARSSSSSADVLQLAHHSTSYYAFTRGEANGFVIVAADKECFANEIIAYSDSGTLDADYLPDGLRWWLDGCDRALEYAKAKGHACHSSARTVYDDVPPLLSSKWGQGAPYNGKCPIVDGVKAPAGCVATALSQIIYYNEYPADGTGGYAYDAMTDTYSSASSQASKDAVAQLMYDVGTASNMKYGREVSGTQNIDGARAMVSRFNYDKCAVLLSRDFYTDEEWTEMLYNSLAAGSPIFYAGLNGNAGHAFVCDGYQNGYFHFNWGWEGISDGYFLLDALNPKDQGTGGSSSGYNLQQEAVFNLKPAESCSDYPALMYCYTDFDVTEKRQTFSSTATFTGSFLNNSLVPKDITLGLKVVSRDNAVTWLEGGSDTGTLDTYAGPNLFCVPMSGFPAADGQYKVCPAYRDDATGIWYEMRVNRTCTKTYLVATVSENNIKFANSSANGKPQLDFSGWAVQPNPIVAGRECSINVAVTNSGIDYTDEIRLVMVSYTTGQTAMTSSPVALSIASGNTETVTFNTTAPATSGFYKCMVISSAGEQLNAVPPYFNIIEAPSEEDLELTLSALAVEDEDKVSVEDVRITAQITCTGGTYTDGQIACRILDATGDTPIASRTEVFSIAKGETKTVNFSGAFPELEEGKNYQVVVCYDWEGEWLPLGVSRPFATAPAAGIGEITGTHAAVPTSIYDIQGVRVLYFGAGVPVNTGSLSSGVYIVVSECVSKMLIIRR